MIEPALADGVFLAFEDVTLEGEDHPVFRHLDWSLREGEQWCVLGPNGSGKSLLGRAAAGQIMPSRGEVTQGAPRSPGRAQPLWAAVVSPQAHRSAVAQESSFYQSRWHSGVTEGRLTVRGFLDQDRVEEINAYEVGAERSSRRRFLAHRREVRDLLGLQTLWSRKLLYLSNGEMRKVLLAQALLKCPRLLVLDEPLAGLDAATRQRLRRAIPHLMARGQRMLILTSRRDEIPTACTHVLLVRAGRVVASGPKIPVLRHPLARQLARVSEATEARHGSRHLAPASGSETRGRRETAQGTAETGGHGLREAPSPPAGASVRSVPPRPLVSLRHVTIRAGSRFILRDVTWEVTAGQRWALAGPNGAGKTTLLSLIQGDHPQACSQDMEWFGRRLGSTRALWDIRRRIGWMSPELHLHYPPEWGCLEVVCSGYFDSMGLHQSCNPAQRAAARRWLGIVGGAGLAGSPLGSVSQGDQRLVLLARAMVKRPRLLILDEPCQGLDWAHRKTLLRTVDRVVAATGAGLVFVTHHRREVPACITHRLRIRDGRVFGSEQSAIP